MTGRRNLTLTLTADDDYYFGHSWQGELTACTLEPGDAEQLLTGVGDSSWTLKGTAVESPVAASLWRWVWEHAGQIVSYSVATGPDSPTADHPTLSGQAIVGAPPAYGGQASDKTFTFDFEWECLDVPAMSTAPGVYV